MSLVYAAPLSQFHSYEAPPTRHAAIRRKYWHNIIAAVFLVFGTLVVISAVGGQQPFIPNGAHFPNPGGASQTYSTTGRGIDLTGPFFQSMGTNGRTCGTCHQPSDGMSISAADVQRRFLLTQGEDPIFRTVDGSNCNHNIDVSTAQSVGNGTGQLQAQGANGGSQPLATQPFFISINSSVHPLVQALERPGGLVTDGDGQFQYL